MTTERTAYLIILGILVSFAISRAAVYDLSPQQVFIGMLFGFVGGKLIETWKK